MPSKISQIDSTVAVVTPENIAFHYTVAGPFRRFPAFLLDLVIRAAILAAVAVMVSLLAAGARLPGLAMAGTLVLWFLLDWFYGGMFETFMNGQTPGKWVLGIRVISVDGQPINGLQAVMRNILRYLDMWPLLSLESLGLPAPVFVIPTFGLSLGTMLLNDRFQRVGDIICGTMVVVEERRWLSGVAQLDDAGIGQLAAAIPPDFAISRSLAQTLSVYAERRRYFDAVRRSEVARHLAQPLIRILHLPAETSYDSLLCALYYRAFIADRAATTTGSAGASPFAPARAPMSDERRAESRLARAADGAEGAEEGAP